MILRLAAVSVLCLVSATFLACCCGTPPPVGAGGSPSAATSTGSSLCGGVYGDAGAGDPCVTDCDCCGGSSCTTEKICVLACP